MIEHPADDLISHSMACEPTRPSTYRTNGTRVAFALAAGAIAGGILTAVVHYEWVRRGLGGSYHDGTLPGLRANFILGSLIYGVGLAMAAPAWFALHRRGYRQWWTAAGLGTGLSLIAPIAFIIVINVADERPIPLPESIDPQWLLFFALIGVIGGAVGFVVWRTAYRRVNN